MDINVTTLPSANEKWFHHSGKPYIIVVVTNKAALDPEKFPLTVVYQDTDGNVWSRPASAFVRKFRRAVPMARA